MKHISSNQLEKLVTDYVHTDLMPQFEPSPYEVTVELKFSEYVIERVELVVARPLSKIPFDDYEICQQKIRICSNDVKTLLTNLRYSVHRRVRLKVLPPSPLMRLRNLAVDLSGKESNSNE